MLRCRSNGAFSRSQLVVEAHSLITKYALVKIDVANLARICFALQIDTNQLRKERYRAEGSLALRVLGDVSQDALAAESHDSRPHLAIGFSEFSLNLRLCILVIGISVSEVFLRNFGAQTLVHQVEGNLGNRFAVFGGQDAIEDYLVGFDACLISVFLLD